MRNLVNLPGNVLLFFSQQLEKEKNDERICNQGKIS